MYNRKNKSQTSNAYSCFCQLLARISYVIENAKNSMYDAESQYFMYNSIILDIYSQIYDNLPNVDVSPFIHACDLANKETVDFITLITSVLFCFDPSFTSEYSSCIFFTSLQKRNTNSYEKSFFFNLNYDQKNGVKSDIDDIIKEQYSDISANSKVLLFHPENSFEFTFSSRYLSLGSTSLDNYWLFSFVVVSEENPLHYILYIYQYHYLSSAWICVEDNVITEVDESEVKYLSSKYEVVLIGYVDNFTKISKINESLSLLKTPKIEVICPLDDINSTTFNENDNEVAPIQPDCIYSYKPTINTEIKTKATESISVSSDIGDSSNYDDECEIKVIEKKAKIYIFSVKEMNFKHLYKIKFIKWKHDFLPILKELCQKKRCVYDPTRILYTTGKRYSYLSNYKDETYFEVYIEKRSNQGMMRGFVNSKQDIVTIVFRCDFIPSLIFKGTFHKIQCASQLSSYCQKYLEIILPGQTISCNLKIKKVRYDIDLKEYRNKTIEYILNEFCNDNVVYFSYSY